MKKIILLLIASLFIGTVSAADYISLEGEDKYCNRFGIWFWCSEEGARFLEENLSPQFIAEIGYINDIAFSDRVRYTGDIEIINVDVSVDLEDTSTTKAVYRLFNKGDTTESIQITALATPVRTDVFVDESPLNVDPLLEGIDITLAPQEQKELTLEFTEELYGRIYGFNINLLFDDKTTDNHITSTGNYVFVLPTGTKSVQCAPGDYFAKPGARPVITWQKEDYVPWTNSFTDLVCRWSTSDELDPIAVEDTTQEGGGSDWITWLVLILIILGVLYYLNKTERLEGVKDKLWDLYDRIRP